MGWKSRGGWTLAACMRKCANEPHGCNECLRFSNYKELPNECANAQEPSAKPASIERADHR